MQSSARNSQRYRNSPGTELRAAELLRKGAILEILERLPGFLFVRASGLSPSVPGLCFQLDGLSKAIQAPATEFMPIQNELQNVILLLVSSLVSMRSVHEHACIDELVHYEHSASLLPIGLPASRMLCFSFRDQGVYQCKFVSMPYDQDALQKSPKIARSSVPCVCCHW